MGMDGPAAVADGRITVRAARLAGSLLAATTFLVAVAGLALMAWDWSTPVPAGYFGFRGSDGSARRRLRTAAGALLTSRRPRHPIGWLFATAAILLAASFATFEYGLAATAGHSLPAARYAGWFQLFVWVLFLALLTVYVFLLFPTGRLPGPRWRPVGWLGGAFAVLATVGVAAIPGGDTPNLPGLRNPFGITPAAIPVTLIIAGLAGMLSCAVLAAWSLVARARRGQAVERQQVKWLAYSGCLVAPALVPAVSLSLTKGLPARIAAGVLIVAIATMPVAVAVAVLRCRLYDLDIVVRKTVVAALVAGAFTAIDALVVAGIGALSGQHGSGARTFAAAGWPRRPAAGAGPCRTARGPPGVRQAGHPV